jgi:hypothetical protein
MLNIAEIIFDAQPLVFRIRKRFAFCNGIRIRFTFWIRIRMKNEDQDPAAGKFILRAKSQGTFGSKS